MARKRQLVLMKGNLTPLDKLQTGPVSNSSNSAGPSATGPLGSVKEVRESLARFNTASDGAARSASLGTELLHGPGMIVELATAQDPVQQAMVTVTDDDIAWPVLSRLCKAAGWKMVDVETGRMFG